MENLYDKERYIWRYENCLDMARLEMIIYQKTGNKIFYDFSMDFLAKAKDYKNKLKLI